MFSFSNRIKLNDSHREVQYKLLRTPIRELSELIICQNHGVKVQYLKFSTQFLYQESSENETFKLHTIKNIRYWGTFLKNDYFMHMSILPTCLSGPEEGVGSPRTELQQMVVNARTEHLGARNWTWFSSRATSAFSY